MNPYLTITQSHELLVKKKVKYVLK
jgi:hypothetical protein